MTDDGWLADAELAQAWLRYADSQPTPFFIPGHKRKAAELAPMLGRLLDSDVPLFGGLDQIRVPVGALRSAEAKGAALWGADWCRYSTGGSTHANQVAALAVAQPGDTVLVARNSHRSVLMGLVFAGLRPVWIPAEVDAVRGVPVGLSLSALDAALDQHPSAAAVFCVEPGYLGHLSDRAAVIAAAHARDLPVVVDQAWGAHLGFGPGLPQHALALGADVMVMSAHKTLPAYSQAAIIVAQTSRVDEGRLERAFEAANTTSPAGAILASIDAARALLASAAGSARLAMTVRLVDAARGRLRDLGIDTLRPADAEPGRYDPTKLVLTLAASGLSGLDLEDGLLARGIGVEMADRDTVVPLVSMLDDNESVDRLIEGIDEVAATAPRVARAVAAAPHWSHQAPQELAPREAFFAPHQAVPFADAIGQTSAELIAPYPPGIPLVVPGERLTTETLDALDTARRIGTRIAYAADESLESIVIVATDLR